MKISFAAAVLLSLSVNQIALAAPPSPGDGLLPGSELSRSSDKYPDQKKFWGDDAVSKALDSVSTDTGGFLTRMWAQYGPRVPNEALWQANLRAAIVAAQAGDWARVAHDCEQCIANNPNAADAKLLREVAVKKLGYRPKGEHDAETLMGTRQRAADFLQGNKAKVPVADGVLRQTLQGQSATSGGVRSFGELGREIRSKAR